MGEDINLLVMSDHFSNISNRVKDVKDEMYKAQHALHLAHGDLTLCMRERVVVRNYTTTIRVEESFFK